MNQTEYEWVRQTRRTLLDFCTQIDPNDFTRRNGFALQNVRDTLVHIADCYVAWLGSFVLEKTKKPITPKDERHHFNVEKINEHFEQVDSIVNEFFERHGNQFNKVMEKKIPWREASETLSITPGKLLMHTITHEFHHKGQIVAMLRQMGYEPPNTDVLGTED
ncbi:DinB family protein [Bacillus xiapuensis]|uniref:DinB family protein n=1 Tax=Bacillus xiapuensis TaxID=2014075 RepID=A0ABU6NDX8_9BACI|nr:DinB family protein [Bacillus xiapuensis]